MIVLVYQIQCNENGIGMEQKVLRNDGDKAETIVAKIIDNAAAAAGDFVMKAVGNGIAVQGKDIETEMQKLLNPLSMKTLRQQLKDVGYEIN